MLKLIIANNWQTNVSPAGGNDVRSSDYFYGEHGFISEGYGD